MNRLVKLILCLLPWGKPADPDPDPTPDPVPEPAPPPPLLPEFEQNVAYGLSPLQKGDIYRPPGMRLGDLAPVILMVHGGGWANDKGDKANAGVIANKIACWLARGYMVISINYDLWTSTNGITPLQEGQDVGLALAFFQRTATGGDPLRYTLMGHSAGGHLVSLVATSLPIQKAAGFFLPNGVVCLDSIYDPALAIDTANKTGNKQAIELYKPFGTDRSKWPDESPIECVAGPTGPFYLAYSTNEGPGREKQAKNFAGRVKQFGGAAQFKGYPYDHADMDSLVGQPCDLTDDVVAFIAGLPKAA